MIRLLFRDLCMVLYSVLHICKNNYTSARLDSCEVLAVYTVCALKTEIA